MMKLPPIRTNPNWDNMLLVHCPLCAFEYVHPVGVVIIPINGQKLTTNGTTILLEPCVPEGRGTVIALQYWCEGCHHAFLLRYAFHKGVTEVTVEDRGITDGTHEMWRD